MSNILRIPSRRPVSADSKMDLDVPQIVTINQIPPCSEPDFEDEYVSEEDEIDEIIDDDLPEVPFSRPKVNGKGKAKTTPTNTTPHLTPPPAESPKRQPDPEIPPLPKRKVGETHVDQDRVEKVIKAHGDILPPSKDAVFLISLATEEFIKRLANAACIQASHGNSITQLDIALVVEHDNYIFLRETIATPIPLSIALQKRAQKENERTLIATELVHPPSTMIGNGTTAHSHKKRQPPLPKHPAVAKNKTRTSARQANGRSSTLVSGTNSAPILSSVRPKRAAAQKGRESWVQADEDDDADFDEENIRFPPLPNEDVTSAPMDVDINGTQWRMPSRQLLGNGAHVRPGLVKGFGPGAYGKVGGLSLGSSGNRVISGSPVGGTLSRSRDHWGFQPEPTRNTGRTIYSDRMDEEVRKAAVEAEEQRRFKRARQKFEQVLMDQDEDELPTDGRTTDI